MNAPPSQESLLLDYIHRLDKHKAGRAAVLVHLSRLKPYNRREHHLRAAASTFDPLVKNLQGQLFMLESSDLMLIFKKDAKDAVDTAVVKLKFMFGDDPLLENTPKDQDKLCTWYNVEPQYDQLLGMVQEWVAAQTDKNAPVKAGGGTGRNTLLSREQSGEPMTPRHLGRLENALMRADLTNMVRRQFICSLVGESIPQEVFSELFIAIHDLQQTLMPNINLGSNQWLFQHLTSSLDKRILSMLSKNDRNMTGEISINLNVATLLSQDFLKFDDQIMASMRGSMILELHWVDIISDLNSFVFARDFVKERGYRICIDGLDEYTLPYADRKKMGVDFAKIRWSPALLNEETMTIDELKACIQSMGEARLVLCHCDDRGAIEFGQAVGVQLFQGRHIENLLAEENRRRNMRRRKGFRR